MEPDIFTHTFEFDVDGVIVKGEVEFNTDKKISMDIKQAGVPLQAETLDIILQMFDLIKEIENANGVINLVKIKKKVS